MGRKQKPYQTSWGKIIPGLYREVDGRWRILATRKKFTEPDERLAIQRFRREFPPQSVFVPIARSVDASDLAEITDELGVEGGAIQIFDREQKIEVGYLTGPNFRLRVETIVEAFSTMNDDLFKEKKAAIRQWAKREEQIHRVMEATSGMYGDLQGIAGKSLQEIEGLEMDLAQHPSSLNTQPYAKNLLVSD